MTQIFWKASLRKGAVDKPMNIFPREPFQFLVQGLIKFKKKTAFQNINKFFHSKIAKNASKDERYYRRPPEGVKLV